MRGSRSRTWIKLHVNGMLNGSVRYQLSPAQRSVWVDLLALAAIGPVPGIIADNDQRPYPESFIANRLNLPLSLLKSTLDQCKQEGRIKISEQGIIITHWAEYQSEYDRQKPYRADKLQDKLQSLSVTTDTKVTESAAPRITPPQNPPHPTPGHSALVSVSGALRYCP